tara:strand:+ start:2307 stop:2567 length:261 start_codon:yes stop_codon:yes gene_type:complete
LETAVVATTVAVVTCATDIYLNFAFQFHSSKRFFASPSLLAPWQLCYLRYSSRHSYEALYIFDLVAHTDRTLAFDRLFVDLVFRIV